MHRWIALSLAGLITASVGLSTLGDTLHKTDGRTLEGKVISETPDAVIFEVSSGGISMRQKVPRAQIRSITKPVKAGPPYAFIPLWGEFGTEVTGAAFNRALAEARREGAKIIILSIDSPGGLIADQEIIVQAMRQAKDLQFVAFVRKHALSAAAIVSLACPTIVMTPDASIGAAVPIKFTPDGTPKNIEEKMASVVRAQDRAAAALGKRTDLWARAMTEMDLELSYIEDEAGARLVEGGPETGGKPVKKKGTILTLTADEARSFGLSAATLNNVPSIHTALALPAWHEAGTAAADLMINFRRDLRARERERSGKLDELIDYVADVTPKVQQIDARIKQLQVAAREEEDKISDLRAKAQAEIDAAQAEYEKGMAEAKAAQSPGQAVKVREQSKAKIAAITRRHEQEKRDSRAALNALTTELNDLLKRRNDLLAAAPKPPARP